MYTPTAKSYFSGGGLMDIGFKQAGVEIIQSVDLDPVATGYMKRNKHFFGHDILTEDISRITVLDQPKSDVMIFTWPCTKYSAIGDIHGVRTGDELFLHGFRHIVLEQPEMYWVENVPGMTKFRVVMEAIRKIPGYYINMFCPIDAATWLPQKRERLLLVGTKKPFTIDDPSPIRNRPTIKDILELDPEFEMPDYVMARIKGKYRDKPIIVDPDDHNAIAPTCVAHYAKDLGTRLVKDKNVKHGVRPFTVREYARLQGVPDDYKLDNTRASYRMIGNGVAVPMARWCGLQTMKYFN